MRSPPWLLAEHANLAAPLYEALVHELRPQFSFFPSANCSLWVTAQPHSPLYLLIHLRPNPPYSFSHPPHRPTHLTGPSPFTLLPIHPPTHPPPPCPPPPLSPPSPGTNVPKISRSPAAGGGHLERTGAVRAIHAAGSGPSRQHGGCVDQRLPGFSFYRQNYAGGPEDCPAGVRAGTTAGKVTHFLAPTAAVVASATGSAAHSPLPSRPTQPWGTSWRDWESWTGPGQWPTACKIIDDNDEFGASLILNILIPSGGRR